MGAHNATVRVLGMPTWHFRFGAGEEVKEGEGSSGAQKYIKIK